MREAFLQCWVMGMRVLLSWRPGSAAVAGMCFPRRSGTPRLQWIAPTVRVCYTVISWHLVNAAIRPYNTARFVCAQDGKPHDRTPLTKWHITAHAHCDDAHLLKACYRLIECS